MTINELNLISYEASRDELRVVVEATQAQIEALDTSSLTIYTEQGDRVTTYTGYNRLYSITTYSDSDNLQAVFKYVSETETKIASLETIVDELLVLSLMGGNE